MSIFNDKSLKGVAEAVAKIMEAEKKAKMDYDKDGKIESPKDEVWGSRLRAAKMAGKLKEEEELDEAKKKPYHKDEVAKKIGAAMNKADDLVQKGRAERAAARAIANAKYGSKMKKEEVEQLQEYESKGGVYKHKAKLEKGIQYGETDWDKEEKEAKKMSSPKRAQKGYGARQNMGLRGLSDGTKKKKVNEELSFTEMLELYNEHGLKVIAPIEKEEIEVEGNTIEVIDADKINGFVETVVEEADEKEFNDNLEKNKAKAAGKAKQPDLAKGDVQAVKQEEFELDEEYEYISEAEYLELDEEEQQLWEAVTSQSYSNLRDKKSKVPATEFGAKGTKTKVLDQIRSHEFRKRHSTGKNVYATDFKVGKKDTTEMMYRKKSGKKGQVPSQRAGVRRNRYDESVQQIDEVAPPGREKQVKALKKVPGIDNPWAVSWASYRKSHPKKKD